MEDIKSKLRILKKEYEVNGSSCKYYKNMKDFYPLAQKEISICTDGYDEMEKNYKESVLFFGEDPKKMTMEDFLLIFSKFIIGGGGIDPFIIGGGGIDPFIIWGGGGIDPFIIGGGGGIDTFIIGGGGINPLIIGGGIGMLFVNISEFFKEFDFPASSEFLLSIFYYYKIPFFYSPNFLI